MCRNTAAGNPVTEAGGGESSLRVRVQVLSFFFEVEVARGESASKTAKLSALRRAAESVTHNIRQSDKKKLFFFFFYITVHRKEPSRLNCKCRRGHDLRQVMNTSLTTTLFSPPIASLSYALLAKDWKRGTFRLLPPTMTLTGLFFSSRFNPFAMH